MADGPWLKFERELYDRTRELVSAAEALKRLRSQQPVGDLQKRLKLQDEIADAIKLLVSAEEAYKKASDALLESLEQDPRPEA